MRSNEARRDNIVGNGETSVGTENIIIRNQHSTEFTFPVGSPTFVSTEKTEDDWRIVLDDIIEMAMMELLNTITCLTQSQLRLDFSLTPSFFSNTIICCSSTLLFPEEYKPGRVFISHWVNYNDQLSDIPSILPGTVLIVLRINLVRIRLGVLGKYTLQWNKLERQFNCYAAA